MQQLQLEHSENCVQWLPNPMEATRCSYEPWMSQWPSLRTGGNAMVKAAYSCGNQFPWVGAETYLFLCWKISQYPLQHTILAGAKQSFDNADGPRVWTKVIDKEIYDIVEAPKFTTLTLVNKKKALEESLLGVKAANSKTVRVKLNVTSLGNQHGSLDKLASYQNYPCGRTCKEVGERTVACENCHQSSPPWNLKAVNIWINKARQMVEFNDLIPAAIHTADEELTKAIW